MNGEAPRATVAVIEDDVALRRRYVDALCREIDAAGDGSPADTIFFGGGTPSLLDAAGDLGARPFRTFRSVIVPLLLPAIAAGSIFTFSLSLGDYIVPQLVNNGKEKFMFGTLINSTLGAPNQPLAAAYTLWPLLIVVLYLLAMKRAGAFENL